MVGKSRKALREEGKPATAKRTRPPLFNRDPGLQKTDNNLDQTTWPQVQMINQKNYYTEYLKRDDQYLAYRTLQEENTNRMVREARDRDRALAQTSNGVTLADSSGAVNGDDDGSMEDGSDAGGPHGSKIIVIHPGSQNLRIGFANDALPKTVPMCIARKARQNETESGDGEPRPKRLKIDDEVPDEPEKWFGDEFATQFNQMCQDLKTRMRNNKRRLLPNSKELIVNFNRRTMPDIISEHNDPQRIDWTEIPPDPPDYFVGQDALRLPDESRPRYKLVWPMRYGCFNENDYMQQNLMLVDFATILEEAIKTLLNLPDAKEWQQYSCVFLIPDLYERNYVTFALDSLIRDFGFKRVCFMQESLAASFGAGYSTSCIVDIGAQKTSVCCVEDGMCVEESRINLKYGGADVTELFIKMMLYDHFPYSDIDLRRRHDYLLADELKQKFCSMNESEVSPQLYEFHLRAAGQDTRKYSFKTYDETMCAPMGYFKPGIFDHWEKLQGRRKLMDRSYDLYDGSPNDPYSNAQATALQYAGENIPSAVVAAPEPTTLADASPSTPTKEKQQPFNLLSRLNDINDKETPRSSVAGTPAPEGSPAPTGRTSPVPGAAAEGNGGPAQSNNVVDPTIERIRAAEERDKILPIMPLDVAILRSIQQGAKSDDRKMRDFFGGIMVVGGGAKVPGFNSFLEVKLREMLPGYTKEILIGQPPRDLDQQLVVWKGGSVFGRLSTSGNDSWVYRKEYEMLGSKLLAQKCMWNW